MKLKDLFSYIYQSLFFLLLFLIPSNLFYKIIPKTALVNGLLIDYLIPKIYLTDIVVLGILIIFIMNFKIKRLQKIKTKISLAISLSIAILFLRQIYTTDPVASTWYLLKLIEITCLYLALKYSKQRISIKIIITAIFTTLIFQSFLALYQFYWQQSFGGYLFLGETAILKPFSINTQFFLGKEQILPYGTTPHPNILAGILVIYSILGWWLINKHKIINQQKNNLKWVVVFISAITLWAVFLTQSLSAWITLIFGTIILFSKTINKKLTAHATKTLFLSSLMLMFIPIIITVLTLYFPFSQSLQRRNYLNQAALNMLIAHPFFGVGLNQFTNQVEKFTQVREVVRFVQPAHHLGMLWLAETGLLGFITLALILKQFNHKKLIIPFIILLPIAALDHYLLTQNQGLLLATIFFNYFDQT